jgi:hypothetical protein
MSWPVSVDELRKHLSYNPETGVITRIRKPRNTRWKAGETTGSPNNHGYIKVGVLRHKFTAHRLAFALHYGRWPNGQIDHIDHDRANNKITNLREVTEMQNHQNAAKRSDNTSGYKGVSRVNRKIKTWQASIKSGGKQKFLGTFLTAEEAACAYDSAARELHGEHACLNFPDQPRALTSEKAGLVETLQQALADISKAAISDQPGFAIRHYVEQRADEAWDGIWRPEYSRPMTTASPAPDKEG